MSPAVKTSDHTRAPAPLPDTCSISWHCVTSEVSPIIEQTICAKHMSQKWEVFVNKLTGEEVFTYFGVWSRRWALTCPSPYNQSAFNITRTGSRHARTHALSQNKRNTYGVTLGSSARPIVKRPLLSFFNGILRCRGHSPRLCKCTKGSHRGWGVWRR